MSKNKISIISIILIAVIIAIILVYNINRKIVEISTTPSKPETKIEVSDNSRKEILAIKKDDVVIGDINAPITIVEYASFSCHHCAIFHKDVFTKIEKIFIKDKKVKFIFRHFPLDTASLKAALLLQCSPQDKQPRIIKYLFNTQADWARSKDYISSLKALLSGAGFVNNKAADICLKKTSLEDKIWNNRNDALKILQINSTPSLIINGKMYQGSKKWNDLSIYLDSLLTDNK